MFMEKNVPSGLSAPAPGLYDHNIQTSSSLKLLGQLNPNCIPKYIFLIYGGHSGINDNDSIKLYS